MTSDGARGFGAQWEYMMKDNTYTHSPGSKQNLTLIFFMPRLVPTDMFHCMSAELLARVLVHLPLPDLLVCMRVRVQWHEVARAFTDWELERGRCGVSGNCWQRHVSNVNSVDHTKMCTSSSMLSTQTPSSGAGRLSERGADALCELGRALGMERELLSTCLLPSPSAQQPPAMHLRAVDPIFDAGCFNGDLFLSFDQVSRFQNKFNFCVK